VTIRRLDRRRLVGGSIGLAASAALAGAVPARSGGSTVSRTVPGTPPAPGTWATFYRTVAVDGVNVFYREAGDPRNPTILLLHGFPSSSHMFRDLIPLLADRFHLVAPDYPGFGYSDAPGADDFAYTFERLADVTEGFVATLGFKRYSLYVQDYGAPVGFRLAARNPERVEAIVSQNGNAYEEGLTPFWDQLRAYWADPSPGNEAPLRALLTKETTVFQYTEGYRDPARVSPDAWTTDQFFLDRPGNQEIQLDLFYDYRTNVAAYPEWHAYFRAHRPPLLAVWGRNDPIFGPDGARAFVRDLPDAEIRLLDTGHFALEDHAEVVAGHIRRFVGGRTAS
jgi:pimeloyl-ACP methyl ester carboxylesterase